MVFGSNVVSTLVLVTLLLKIGLILVKFLSKRGRTYTAFETEEIFSGLIRVLILLMSYSLVNHLRLLAEGHSSGRRLLFARFYHSPAN
ncbi:uncharacterized protein LOC144154055 isoform X3 [Haemaphysalis longicornis]